MFCFFTGHSGCVNRLCWSETGQLLASTGDDQLVLLWDLQHTGEGSPGGPLGLPQGGPPGGPLGPLGPFRDTLEGPLGGPLGGPLRGPMGPLGSLQGNLEGPSQRSEDRIIHPVHLIATGISF